MFLQQPKVRRAVRRLGGYGASELLADLRLQLIPYINSYGQQLTTAVTQFFDQYKGQLQSAIQSANTQRADMIQKISAIQKSKANLDAANSLLQSGQFTQTDQLRQDINNMIAQFADEMKSFIKDEVAKAKSSQPSNSASSTFKFGG